MDYCLFREVEEVVPVCCQAAPLAALHELVQQRIAALLQVWIIPVHK